MEDSQLAEFIEKVQSDPALRRKLFYAEAALSKDVEAVIAIAAEAGYTITGSRGAPEPAAPTPAESELDESGCWLTCGWVGETCCWVLTSALVASTPQ